jgi:capsular polysaccharide transport system permease protein
MADTAPDRGATPPGVPLRPARARARLVTLRTIAALILREMSTTYGRSPGGYIWAVLEPALGIALLSMIFSLGFRSPSLGTNFPIFYATGLLPFFMFLTAHNNVSQSINYSRALLAYPRVTFADAIFARLILGCATQLIVGIVVFWAILAIFETRTTLALDRIMMSYAMAIALVAGVGTLNCYLISLYPLWQRAWSISMRPAILVSGVIFIYESVPAPYGDWLLWNPLMHVTSEMRAGFYPNYEAAFVAPIFVFGFAALCGLVGLVFLRRYNRDIREL